MSNKLVRKVLETTTQAWATANGISVAWENTSFSPPVTGAYARSMMLPGETVSRMLSEEHRSRVGIYQITLVMPRNTGPKACEDLIASLDLYFTTATPLVNGSTKVYITTPMSPGPPNPDSDLYEVPVFCRYRSEFVG